MKASTIFCALLAIAVGAQIVSAHIEDNKTLSKREVEDIYLEENEPMSGMFFSTEYVAEEYVCDGIYCIRYDDADANMFDSEIFVDRATYESVIGAIKSGEEMVGHLVLCEDLSSDEVKIFTFVQDVKF